MYGKLMVAAAALSLAATASFADSISPDSYSATLAIGESVTIKKIVTVSKGRPSSAKVDVFFLADTTGSMGGIINSARVNANTIIDDIAGLGDVQFAVGEYKDTTDPITYRLNQELTASKDAVTSGLDAWSRSGGGDTPEANLIALEEVAKNGGWRDGSRRFVVQFGDAVGHVGRADDDPEVFPASSEENAIAALQAANATVLVAGTSGMNRAWGDVPAGQAERIAAATGGSFNLINSNPGAALAETIKSAIDSSFASYDEVGLVLRGAPDGVDVDLSAAYLGDYSRDVAHTFEFSVTFTGMKAGSFDFSIDALVDGGVIATEYDSIVVTSGGASEVPLPAALPLSAAGLAILGLMGRRRRG